MRDLSILDRMAGEGYAKWKFEGELKHCIENMFQDIEMGWGGAELELS